MSDDESWIEPDHFLGPDTLHHGSRHIGYDKSTLRFEVIERMTKLTKWRIDPSSIEFDYNSTEINGGNATVSRAFRRRETVAVKKLRISDETDVNRVLGLALREASFLADLSHPNIIDLKGFAENISKDIIWLVFPWEAHGNLMEFVKSRDLDIPERIWLINDVTRGVEYLHVQKPPICHGDLKSLNVLVNSKYRALITDFGSARRLSKKVPVPQIKWVQGAIKMTPEAIPFLEATFCPSSNTITLTGNKYSLRWAAPELLISDQLGSWSDIWALGWIYYEVMTNSVPFQDTPAEVSVVERVLKGDLPSVTNDNRMSPMQGLCSLMINCWKIVPTYRPTAEQCRKTLDWMPMIAPGSNRITDPHVPEARSADLLLKIGAVDQQQGKYSSASSLFQKALDLSSSLGDTKGIASALWNLAEVQRSQGHNDPARELYQKALKAYSDVGDTNGRASALCGLAQVEGQRRGEHSHAVTLCSEALQIYTANGHKRGRAEALLGLAEAYRSQESLAPAMKYYCEAQNIFTDIGHRIGMVHAVWGIGEVYRLRGEYSHAETQYYESLALNCDFVYIQKRADCLWGLAEMDCRRLRPCIADGSYSQALRIYVGIGDEKGRASTLCGLAKLRRKESYYGEAFRLCSEALEICTGISHERGRADALWGLAEVCRFQAKYDKAHEHYCAALQAYTNIGDKIGIATASLGRGRIHQSRKNYARAVIMYSTALRSYKEAGHCEGITEAMRSINEAHRLWNTSIYYLPDWQSFSDVSQGQENADALWGLAEIHGKDRTAASTLYTDSLAISVQLGDERRQADALLGLGEVHRLQRQHKEAVKVFSDARQLYGDLGGPSREAEALIGLGAIHQLRKEYYQAIKLFSDAHRILTTTDNLPGRYIAALEPRVMQGREEIDSELAKQAAQLAKQVAQLSLELGGVDSAQLPDDSG